MKQLRLHVLSIPYTRTTENYYADAFTQKVLQFCKMMHQRGHYIIHYGVEGSNPECNENVIVVSNNLFMKDYGSNGINNYAYNTDLNTDTYHCFVQNCITEVEKRKQPLDIILPFYGGPMRAITDNFPDLLVIEPGIGYVNAAYAPFRIYESNAVRTIQNTIDNTGLEPSFYDKVIPPFFDLKNYPIEDNNQNKRNYVAFLGRVSDTKGLNVAIQACQCLGVKLKVGGVLCADYVNYDGPENVEYIGPCNLQQRYELLHNAIALLMPTRYMEPFGYVQIEALLSGTAIITTDGGSFPETNKNNITGYRCNSLDDFIVAIYNCCHHKIDYNICRKEGEKYSLEQIAPLYEQYFNHILNLIGEGGYTISLETQQKIQKKEGLTDEI